MARVNQQAPEITEKKHWRSHHQTSGYTKWMSVVDNNIVHTWIEATTDVILDFMDVELLRVVLHESALVNRQFHILFDLRSVVNITLQYKRAITDLFFNWSPILGMIGFYNISESMRITVETFAAVAPQKISVIFAENYEEGIGHIISFKEGKSMSEKLDKKELAIIPSTKQFLQVIARISWLNMLDETVTIPPRNTQYYLFFKAIDSLRCDLLAKEIESKREIQLLQQRYEHRITQMVIQMNAQAETNKKFIHEAEKEATTLKRRIETLESELNRSSTTHSSKLQELLDQIYSVDVSPTIKRTLTDCCSRLIEAHAVEKRLSAELTESDSLFLSQLQKKFPKLNKRELRICMLVKLNYDTAEIAHSVGISTRGTESLRYRVHKKLGLGKHQSIKTYLSEFAIT